VCCHVCVLSCVCVVMCVCCHVCVLSCVCVVMCVCCHVCVLLCVRKEGGRGEGKESSPGLPCVQPLPSHLDQKVSFSASHPSHPSQRWRRTSSADVCFFCVVVLLSCGLVVLLCSRLVVFVFLSS